MPDDQNLTWELAERMLGDRVFVLSMLVHALLDQFPEKFDASLDSTLGSGKAWSILDFGEGRRYRVTIEDEPEARRLSYRDINPVRIRSWDE